MPFIFNFFFLSMGSHLQNWVHFMQTKKITIFRVLLGFDEQVCLVLDLSTQYPEKYGTLLATHFSKLCSTVSTQVSVGACCGAGGCTGQGKCARIA